MSWRTSTAGWMMILAAVFSLKKTLLPAWNAGDFLAVAPAVGAIFGGLGLVFARDHSVTSEDAGLKTPPMDPRVDAYVPPSVVVNAGKANAQGGFITPQGVLFGFGITAVVIMLVSLFGCAPLNPGADVLVVRAEQAETTGKAAVKLVLVTDDANRDFYKAAAPEFHAFAEKLRAPVTVADGTPLRLWSATIWNLDHAKQVYIAHRGDTNGSGDFVAKLVAATGAMSDLATESNRLLSTATNLFAEEIKITGGGK